MREALHSAVAAALVIAMAFAGCAEQRGPSAAGWVERAREANATADDAVAREDWDAARTALRAAIGADTTGIDARDVRIVKQDLLYRLADVELAAGDPAEALRVSDEGLELGRDEDVFTANLLVTKGRALEMMDREREAAGVYFDALEINDALLRRTLEEGAE